MLKYVSKFAMDILPSVVATIIGAYIVNHYIVTKPAADAPRSPPRCPRPTRRRPRSRPRLPPSPAISPRPVSGRRAFPRKPCSSKRLLKSRRSSKSPRKNPPTSRPRPRASRWRPVVTSRLRAKRRLPSLLPAPAAPAVAAAPVVAAPNTTPPVEATVAAPDEHRDANELARAAIERLRGTGDGSPRPQEAARVPDPPRVGSAPPVAGSAPPVAAPVASSSAGSAASATDHGLHPGSRARRRWLRRSASSDAAGRYPGGRAVPGAARSARRGRGAPEARTHQRRRRHAAGGEVGVSRGIAEIVPRIRAKAPNFRLTRFPRTNRQSPRFKTVRNSGRACRRRAQSRFARLRPWDAG